RPGILREIEQADTDLEILAASPERAFDKIVKFLDGELKPVEKVGRLLMHQRYRCNHIEPTEFCKRAGNLLTQGKRQAFLPRGAISQEGKNADAKPISRRQRRANFWFPAPKAGSILRHSRPIIVTRERA